MCSALNAFMDQSRRTNFNLDPADPSAQHIWEVAQASSRKASREPTKAYHQRYLVFAGNRIVERLNDPERMFHLKGACFPAWL